MADEVEICPFCNNIMDGRKSFQWSTCPNRLCRSHSFIPGNKVILNENPSLGVGTIISVHQRDYSIYPSLHTFESDDWKRGSDTSHKPNKRKFNVIFSALNYQTIYPKLIRHYLWDIGQKIRFDPDYDLSTPLKSPRLKDLKVGLIQNRNLHHKSGIVKYNVLRSDGQMVWIDETLIRHTVEDPISEFMGDRITSARRFLLYIWGKQIQNLYQSNTLKVVTNSRLSLLPHQISVAHHLLHQPEARMILADEVGLGKTIEAGIYVKEMLARKLARRVLIIAPASLSSQWEFEMQNKFNLHFKRLDSKTLQNLEVDYGSGQFFHTKTGEEFPLCSVTLQFARLLQCSGRLLEIEWDVVIFDEAHHLRRYLANAKTELYRTTLAYDLAEELAKKTRNILLLTATPIQLHSFDLYSLICLLNPYKYPNFDSFESARKELALLNLIVQHLWNFSRISAFERRSLTYNILNFLPNYSPTELESQLKNKSFRLGLIQKLEKNHFLSEFVIRNRRKRVFPDSKIRRIAKVIDVTFTPEEFAVYNKIHLYLAKIYSQNFEGKNTGTGFVMVVLQKLLTSSAPAILHSLRKRIKYLKENEDLLIKFQNDVILNQEFQDDELDLGLDLGIEDFELDDRLIYQQRKYKMKPKKKNVLNVKEHISVLQDFVSDLTHLKADSKAQKLQEITDTILRENSKEKIIIFTQFKATLHYLSKMFEEKGLDIAHFHGDLTEKQKNQEVRRFKNSATIMFSTEIGGEGRNFQFCHIIINYDLPWNPMRLEQRIGRLDRIGQTQDVIIYNFYIADTVESSIVNAIVERIHLFEESIGSLEPILGGLEKQIADLVLKEDEIPFKFRLEEVISKTSDKIEEVYSKLDDFILDKKSFQRNDVTTVSENSLQFTAQDLQYFLKQFQREYASQMDINQIKEVENHRFYRVTIDPALKSQLFLPNHMYEGVFDIESAQKYEEYDFFALGHDLLMSTAEFCGRDDFSGFSTIISLNSKRMIQKLLPKLKKFENREENEHFQQILKQNDCVYLFYIELQFSGVILEKIIYPIAISRKGTILPSLASEFWHPHGLSDIVCRPSEKPPRIECKLDNFSDQHETIAQLYNMALNQLKQAARARIQELTALNKETYKIKREKLVRDTRLKKQYIKKTLETLNLTLRSKKVKLPTARQLENLEKIENEKKREKRQEYFQKIANEVAYFENEIQYFEDLQEELEFDVPSSLNRLEQFKKLKIDAKLRGFAQMNFVV